MNSFSTIISATFLHDFKVFISSVWSSILGPLWGGFGVPKNIKSQLKVATVTHETTPNCFLSFQKGGPENTLNLIAFRDLKKTPRTTPKMTPKMGPKMKPPTPKLDVKMDT